MQPSNKATVESFSRLGDKVEGNRERIIKVEENIAHFVNDFEKHLRKEDEKTEQLLAQLKEIKDQLSAIKNEFNRVKGIIGGISLVLSGIGIVAVFFKDAILSKFGA